VRRRRSGEEYLHTYLRTLCCEGLESVCVVEAAFGGGRGVNTGVVGIAQPDVGGVWAMLEGDLVDRDWK
jgi:hypothetical protein